MSNTLPFISPEILSDSFSADQIIGNRVKLKKPVTVHEGYPNSDRTRTWEKGFLSPLVQSYLVRDGAVWWVFGEEQPILHVKHDGSALELVPDSGSRHLNKDKPGSSFAFPQLEGLEEYVKKIAVFGGIGLGVYMLLPMVPVIRKGVKQLSNQFAE